MKISQLSCANVVWAVPSGPAKPYGIYIPASTWEHEIIYSRIWECSHWLSDSLWMSVNAGGIDRLLSQARPKCNPAGSGQALAHAALPKDFSLHLQHPCFSITETFPNTQSQRDILTHAACQKAQHVSVTRKHTHYWTMDGVSAFVFTWVNLGTSVSIL